MMGSLRQPIVSPLLLGRARETELLTSALRAAGQGEGKCVLVAGEAGIGKSRLLTEVRREAGQTGFLVLQGNCIEKDASFPYALWVDLLRSFCARLGPAEIRALLGRQASELVKLLPELALSVPDLQPNAPLDSEAEKRRLFESLAQFVTQHAAGWRGPAKLLVILEDLHWSDDTSLDFLHFLARRLSDFPILLVASYRREEASPRLAHLLAQLDRERLAEEIVLGPLGPDEVAAMVRAIFEISGPIKMEFLDLLLSLSEGNPFFVEEILKTLVEAGDIFLANGRWERKPVHEMSKIPRTVEDAVRQRMEPLSPAPQHILKLAAVVGPRFHFSWLEQITGLGEQELLGHLRDLIDRQLVVEESHEEFAFRHALTREAVYATALKRERRDMHRQVAEMLEHLYAGSLAGHLGDLAYHSYQAGVWEKALDYARQAGERAQAMFALREALDHYTRALDAAARLSLPPPFGLLSARAKAYETLGDFEPARGDLEAALATARATGDGRAECEASLELGFLWAARDYARSGQLLLQALAMARWLGDPGLLAQTLNRVGNWHVNRDEPIEAQRYHEEALQIFQSRNDLHGVAETLELLSVAGYVRGNVLEGLACCRQAIPLFEQTSDRRGLIQALEHLMTPGQFDTEVGEPADIGGLAAYGETALKLAREIGWRAGEGIVLASLGECLGPAGDYARALDVLTSARAVGEEIEHGLITTLSHWLLGLLYLDLLAFQDAQQQLEQARAAAEASNSILFLRITTGHLALAYTFRNELERAEALLAPMLGDQPARTRHLRVCWYTQAELALAQDRPARALQIADDLISSAANIDRWGPRGVPRLAWLRGEALAALGRPDEAQAALLDALRGAAAQGRRPLSWRIHAGLGKVYQALARPEEAEREFDLARGLTHDLAAPLPDALRESFLQRALAGMPSPAATSPRRAAKQEYGGLTAREREVAALIGQGKTNAEIAGELVTSKRTIEKHVGNVLSKLEFTSRAQIIAWAIENGLTRRGG